MGECRREGFIKEGIWAKLWRKVIKWNGEAFLGKEYYFPKARLNIWGGMECEQEVWFLRKGVVKYEDFVPH